MGCEANICILVIPPVTLTLVDFTLSFKVNVNFSNLHEMLAFFEITTHLIYVVLMEEADMRHSPVIYLLVSVMSKTPGTSVFQPISPFSYQNWTKQQL